MTGNLPRTAGALGAGDPPLHGGGKGLSHVDVQFRQPVRDVDRLVRVPAPLPSSGTADLRDAIAVINDHADKLNARMFSSFDYAVIARR